MNVMVIAGYDVLADKSVVHGRYVISCLTEAERVGVHMIFVVGGATNPDYPQKTEAEANAYLVKCFLVKRFTSYTPKVIVIPEGDTSAQTLQAVCFVIKKMKIEIDRLVLCAGRTRITGFLVEALELCLLDMAKSIGVYGHPFLEEDDFDSQRKKIFCKSPSNRVDL